MGVLTVLGSTFVTQLRLGRLGLVAALGAAQLVLHESLMWLAPSQSGACSGVMRPVGHHGGGYVMSCGAPMAGMPMPSSAHSATVMFAAHAAATVALALVLFVGERALWFLATFLRPVLRWWPEVPVLAPSAGVRPGAALAIHGPLRFVSGGVGRRGPPLWGVLSTV